MNGSWGPLYMGWKPSLISAHKVLEVSNDVLPASHVVCVVLRIVTCQLPFTGHLLWPRNCAWYFCTELCTQWTWTGSPSLLGTMAHSHSRRHKAVHAQSSQVSLHNATTSHRSAGDHTWLGRCHRPHLPMQEELEAWVPGLLSHGCVNEPHTWL